MEISINERIPEKLLKRERLNFVIEFEGATPSIIEVRKLIAQKLGIDMKQLVVRRIYNEFGATRAKGYAFLYESREELLKTEPDFIKKKNKVDEDTQANEQSSEQEKEQSPKEQEENKEEKEENVEGENNGKEEAKEQ